MCRNIFLKNISNTFTTFQTFTTFVPHDYYQLLGVSKSASADEVKAAFRKLAHQYHPDKPGGNAEKFKEINAAYQVLGDAEKRQKYDQFGSAAFENGGNGGSPFGGYDFSGFQQGGGVDLGEMFGDMFGFGGNRQRRGADVRVDAELSFKDAAFGVERAFTLTRTLSCERCGGTGGEPGGKMKTCDECAGKGVKVHMQRTILGNIQTKSACGPCHGDGEIPEKKCTTCSSTGLDRAQKTLTVEIPAGVEDGATLRVRGEGEATRGGQPGDLHIRIHVEPDRRFEREGDTLFSQEKIGFTQAALGAKIDAQTLDGTVELTIPPGTQGGTQFRLRGKGIGGRRGRGDQIVTVEVVTPTKLSKEQRKLLEELDLKE
ncbi:molecular chaperone DnaJ [Patescibacteria group bacterium]|nr:MAG: molecular chaperone DnaJ [Patescibacteria group bacterium]